MRIGESNNIKDLAPILANTFVEDFIPSNQVFEDYQEYFKSKEIGLGTLKSYLNDQMSDFEVLSITKEYNSLRLEVNDLNYCIRAEEIIKERGLKIDNQSLKLPCIFLFKEVDHFSLSLIDKKGELKEVKDYSVTRNSQILFDQLIHYDQDSIEIAFTLWKYIGGKGKNFLLLISARTCDVKETQIELLNRLMNGDISGFNI